MDTGATEILKFISMENMHHYNSTMVNVDHVDQMRVSYRVDQWSRNRKWWWLPVFWIIGVFIETTYVL